MLRDIIKSSAERQEAWAKELGISEGYLSQILSGKRRPSLKVALKIEKRTGGRVPVSSWASAAIGE